jgi:transcriptional regulator with XRE-family HTH domain
MEKTASERLRDARERAGLNQAQLAQAVGVSRAAVSQWESGDTKSMQPVNLFKVARALNCSAEWLATGNGAIEPNGIVAGVLHELPEEDRQAVFDFIQYKIDRAPQIIASDHVARYTAMIERIKEDLVKRRGAK